MELTRLHENVYYYTNVFENPQWIIDSLNSLDDDEQIYSAITKWYPWLASNNNEDCFGEKKDLYYYNKDSVDNPLAREIIETMKRGVEKICHSFVKDRELDINPNISPFLDMCKYTKGGNLGPHYDGLDGDRSLMYSIVMYFNDDYRGGEISFAINEDGRRPTTNIQDPAIDFWVKPKPGSAIIFPSTYPYFHQSHPIISGEKYMSTSFIFVDGYDPYNPDHVKEYRS